jgi:hypothetical protein
VFGHSALQIGPAIDAVALIGHGFTSTRSWLATSLKLPSSVCYSNIKKYPSPTS